MAVDKSDSNIILIGIEGGSASFSALQGEYFNGGLYRSLDAGANWSKIDLGDSNDVKNGFWHIKTFDGNLGSFYTFGFESAGNSSLNIGLLKSTDSAASWTSIGDEAKNLNITNWGASKDGQTLYLNERDSFVIRKSTDDGTNWTTSDSIQANGPVAVSPTDPNIVLYAGNNILYYSSDGLSSTSQVLDATNQIHDVAFAPSDSAIVYVATEGYLIFKSTDSGASFTQLINIRSEILNGN